MIYPTIVRNDTCTINDDKATLPVAEGGTIYSLDDSRAKDYAEKYEYPFALLDKAPTQQPTEPSTEPTEPSEPSTEPTDPSTEPTEPTTDPVEPVASKVNPDVNGDGVINASDAAEILMYAAQYGAGKVKSFDEYMKKFDK